MTKSKVANISNMHIYLKVAYISYMRYLYNAFSFFLSLSLFFFFFFLCCCSYNNCSMTFCFSFEVLVTLNPIHVDIKGGGPTY